MTNGLGCPSCGAILAAGASCRRCGPPPVPGLRNLRQAAAFVAGWLWIGALALGMVVAFTRFLPAGNEAVGRIVRWLVGG
jgi:hypothetical protein